MKAARRQRRGIEICGRLVDFLCHYDLILLYHCWSVHCPDNCFLALHLSEIQPAICICLDETKKNRLKHRKSLTHEKSHLPVIVEVISGLYSIRSIAMVLEFNESERWTWKSSVKKLAWSDSLFANEILPLLFLRSTNTTFPNL
jgi:hypothetical protein